MSAPFSTPDSSPRAERFRYIATVTSEPIHGLPSNRHYGPFDSMDEGWAALADAGIITLTGVTHALSAGWTSVSVLPLRPVETLQRGSTPDSSPMQSAETVLHPRAEWEWFGGPGHFICASDCRFHLATKVGPWLVSTVGEYLPDSSVREILAQSRGIALEGRGDARERDWLNKAGFEDIGHGRKYETMVFPLTEERCTRDDCDCEMPVVAEWGEIDSKAYNLRGDAQRGHLAMCELWAAKPKGTPARWEWNEESDDE